MKDEHNHDPKAEKRKSELIKLLSSLTEAEAKYALDLEDRCTVVEILEIIIDRRKGSDEN